VKPAAPSDLSLEADGALLLAGAGLAALPAVQAALAHLTGDSAGIRLSGIPGLAALLAADGQIGFAAVRAIGPAARPVRAILFDKNPAMNWGLAWHQDRTICVRERIEVPGYGPWTRKAGLLHVAPPAALLASMITLRLHIDDVPSENAPLLVAPGSHRRGRVPEESIDHVVEAHGIFACLAARGDIWVYATLILHASEAARVPARRRVLQVDYSAESLPGGLEWHGV
jgi:hypothetical protein